MNIPLDCREGVCGTCRGRCESGAYTQDYVDGETLGEDDLAQRKMLSCQTRGQSDASFYFDFDSSLCQSGSTRTVSARVEAVELVSETTAILRIVMDEPFRAFKISPARRIEYGKGFASEIFETHGLFNTNRSIT